MTNALSRAAIALRDSIGGLVKRAAHMISDENYAAAIERVKYSTSNLEISDWRSGEAVKISGLESGLHDSFRPRIDGEILLTPFGYRSVEAIEVPFDIDGKRVSLTIEGSEIGRWRVRQPEPPTDPWQDLRYKMAYHSRYLTEESPDDLVRSLVRSHPELPDIPAARLDLSRLLNETDAAPDGTRLVVGGGHTYRNPAVGEVFLDVSPAVRPDLRADVEDLHLVPNSSVNEVFYERLPPYSLSDTGTQAPAEIFRVLKPGGRLRAWGGFPGYHDEEVAIRDNLIDAGFQNVRLYRPLLHRTGALVTAEKPVI
ncbi:hypothetical protein [Nocardia yamanashiensis]|uniref:hypothetical protein n=1 Tax=Nocardia yamanashiensis TaxID=209247 RepID=UPI000ACDA705|nr:hypothetical protein [Nocardia yamanashiensis]